MLRKDEPGPIVLPSLWLLLHCLCIELLFFFILPWHCWLGVQPVKIYFDISYQRFSYFGCWPNPEWHHKNGPVTKTGCAYYNYYFVVIISNGLVCYCFVTRWSYRRFFCIALTLASRQLLHHRQSPGSHPRMNVSVSRPHVFWRIVKFFSCCIQDKLQLLFQQHHHWIKVSKKTSVFTVVSVKRKTFWIKKCYVWRKQLILIGKFV